MISIFDNLYIKYTSLIIKKIDYIIYILYKKYNNMEDIKNGSFLNYYNINSIKDYDQLDLDIIMNLANTNLDYLNNDNLNIFLDNLYYYKPILSDTDFENLLYNISNNNLKHINELVEYHRQLIHLYILI